MKDLRPIHTFLLVLSVVLILSVVSFIEPTGGIKRADIFSDLRAEEVVIEEEVIIEEVVEVEEEIVEIVEVVEVEQPVHKTLPEPVAEPVDVASGNRVEGAEYLASFFDKLSAGESLGRPVRIAVLGDSFIEGDIFSQDIRELMQGRFGGSGVGYMPITSEVYGFRQSVKHAFSGWETYSISTARRNKRYSLSGQLFNGTAGAYVNYSGSKYRKHLEEFSSAKLLYISSGGGVVTSKVNGKVFRTDTLVSSPMVQRIAVSADSIGSVRFSLSGGISGFTSYGAFLDSGSGVSVDNYSLRGNSGVVMTETDIDIMRQINSFAPVDLIVLEYGLNIVRSDRNGYAEYISQMKATIEHLREGYPLADILIVGVPDRMYSTAGGYRTMPGIFVLGDEQRALAEECGAAFWDARAAMGEKGGMEAFVKRGHAAADHIHMSHKGGRVVGQLFFDALMKRYDER